MGTACDFHGDIYIINRQVIIREKGSGVNKKETSKDDKNKRQLIAICKQRKMYLMSSSVKTEVKVVYGWWKQGVHVYKAEAAARGVLWQRASLSQQQYW